MIDRVSWMISGLVYIWSTKLWVSKRRFEELVNDIQTAINLQAETYQKAVTQLQNRYDTEFAAVRQEAAEWMKAYNHSVTEREYLTYRTQGVSYNEQDRYARLEKEFNFSLPPVPEEWQDESYYDD